MTIFPANFQILLQYVFLYISWTASINAQQQKCIYVKSTGVVDCRNKNLTSVPTLPADARVLDISNNKIEILNQGTFNSCSVTEIYAANNSIKTIHYTVFEKLNSLRILDLSDNQLQNVFFDMPISLEALYLDRNPLSNDYVLQQRLQYLRYLSLDNCNLTRIPNFAQILPVLRYLNLDNNAALRISEDDLKSFKALKVLSISPRVFAGRSKADRCETFGKFTRHRGINVKNLLCHNNRNFQLQGKTFEREYTRDDAWFDTAEDILTWNVRDPDLFDLQNLISNGLGNFFRSLFVRRRQLENGIGKVKEPIKMDDFVVRNPELALRNVFMNGFPLFKNEKQHELTVSSSDAEQLRLFKVNYKTLEDRKPTTLTGNFYFYTKTYRFSCDLTDSVFRSERNLIRSNDFQFIASRTTEKFQHEKLKCSLNDTSDRVTDETLTSMVTDALSKLWLDHAINVGNIALLDYQTKNISHSFIDMYEQRALKTLIEQGVRYLNNLNINSFDVSPSALGTLKENTLGVQLDNQMYNIKIFNLFNYSDFEVKHEPSDESSNAMKLLMSTVVHYPNDNSAILAISSKQDPNDVITFYVNRIEMNSLFELKTVNKVRKHRLLDVNVKIVENAQKHDTFVVQLLKKYLSLELSKEFQRALTFLTNKIDFYTLNAL